jgi:hypothetical protein
MLRKAKGALKGEVKETTKGTKEHERENEAIPWMLKPLQS